MEKADIEALREKVSCSAMLARAGWSIDQKESTRRAVKYRRGDGEIIIVIHDGKGWFDPLSEAKGDVFSLAAHLHGSGFVEALETVAGLIGFEAIEPVWIRPARLKSAPALISRWQDRAPPRPGSPNWRYLSDGRAIPAVVLQAAVAQDLLREGPLGSMWAAHTDGAGSVIGWEERGPQWRGFSTGGSKTLFRFGPLGAARVCITEAAIDAMSLAAIENLRPDTLYVSAGGGWSPATAAAIGVYAAYADRHLVAATDSNRQGQAYVDRIRAIAEAGSCSFERIEPHAEDWNEDLQAAFKTAEEDLQAAFKTAETEQRKTGEGE